MIARLSLALIPWVLLLGGPATAPAQLAPDLVQKGKRATALVEIKTAHGTAFGSAFCIDKSGLFVTNAHVVAEAADNGLVKLVLFIGEKTQRVAKARVVRSSDELDLALLRIDADLGLTPLELGKDDDLTETMPVTSFGYPFGKALAVARDGYPNVSVNSSRITSLRKDEGKLLLVQIDGLLNPGNSGGPVVDPAGKVIGVVAAGVLGAGINFAIPVGRLAEYMASPIILLEAPAIAYGDRSRQVDWTVEVSSAVPGVQLPPGLAVSVTVEGGSAAPRKVFARAVGDGKFKATIVPIPRDPGRRVSVVAIIGGRMVQGTIVDRDIKINGKTIALGDLKALYSGAPPRITTADGRTASGPILGLGKVRLQLAEGREIAIDLDQATSINVNAVGQAPAVAAVAVAVEVKQGAKVLGALQKRVEFKGAEAVAAAAAANRRPQAAPRITVVQNAPAALQAEELLDIGGVLDATTGAVGAGKAIRPPTVAMGAAHVGPAAAAPRKDGIRLTDRPGAHIYSEAFSPDGRLYASGGDDCVIHILEVESGREVRRLVQASWVQGLTFSRDGKKLLAGSFHQRTNSWDLTTGTASLPLHDEHFGDVTTTKLLPDGRRVLTVHDDRVVRIWELVSGSPLREFTSPGPSRNAVTPDAKRLLLASCRTHDVNAVPYSASGQSLRLFDIEDGRQLWSVVYPDGPRIIQLDVSADGERCVAFLSDGTVCSHQMSDGKEAQRLKLAVAPRSDTAALTPDGRRLVTGHDDRSVRLWDLAGGAELARTSLPVVPSGVPAFSPDGEHIAIGSFRGYSCLWTPARPRNDGAPAGPDAPLQRKLPAPITDVAVAGGGRYLLLMLREIRNLAVFDVNAAAVVKLIPLPTKDALIAAGAEKFVLVFPEERLIQRWDLATLTREVTKPSPIHGRVKAIAMGSDSDGPILAHWTLDQGSNPFQPEWFSFIDPEGLKVLKVRTLLSGQFQNVQRQASSGGALQMTAHFTTPNMECRIRASADGRLFGLWRSSTSPAGFLTIALDGKTVESYYDHADYGALSPGPDGRLIFTGLGGVREPGGKPVVRVPEGAGPRTMYLPTPDPLYFLAIDGLQVYGNQQPAAIGIAVQLSGSDTPVVRLNGLGEMDELPRAQGQNRWRDLPLDRRFFWVPSANLLITIPPSNDQLVLRRFDVAQALEQKEGDYLLVTSPSTVSAKAGQDFKHQVAVKSRKGSVTYSVSSGPDGMAISPAGEVTWRVAPKYEGEGLDVVLTIGDASGQEIFHTLRIRVR